MLLPRVQLGLGGQRRAARQVRLLARHRQVLRRELILYNNVAVMTTRFDLRHAGGPSLVGHLAHGAGGAHHHRLVELHQVLAHQLRDVVAGDLRQYSVITIYT